MPLCSSADVILIAPEFSGAGSAIDQFISIADLQMNADLWSAKGRWGEAYLTAHLMVISGVAPYNKQGGAKLSGPITMISVGDVEVQATLPASFGEMAASLSLSKYGVEFDRIKRQGVFGLVAL